MGVIESVERMDIKNVNPCAPVTFKEMECKCTDEKPEIENAIQILKIVQYCWADQIPNEGQLISDYDAIGQAIKCVKEYKEEKKKFN